MMCVFVQEIALAVRNVWEMGHHLTGRLDSFTSSRDFKPESRCTSLHTGMDLSGETLGLTLGAGEQTSFGDVQQPINQAWKSLSNIYPIDVFRYGCLLIVA